MTRARSRIETRALDVIVISFCVIEGTFAANSPNSGVKKSFHVNHIDGSVLTYITFDDLKEVLAPSLIYN